MLDLLNEDPVIVLRSVLRLAHKQLICGKYYAVSCIRWAARIQHSGFARHLSQVAFEHIRSWGKTAIFTITRRRGVRQMAGAGA